MDIALGVIGSILQYSGERGRLSRLVSAESRLSPGVTADGYVPGLTAPPNRISRDHEGRVIMGQGPPSTQDGRLSAQQSSDEDLERILWDLLRRAVIAGLCWVGVRQFIKLVLQEPSTQQLKATRKMLKMKLPARTDLNLDRLPLSAQEIAVANDVVAAGSLRTTFSMIGGLGDLKNEIEDIVTIACSPIARQRGLSAPRGILLSGAPGTGKTMLAKAIAHESGATFINVKMSSVNSKWVGESEKYVAAIFSMANKLAPSIIFIDEIDGFLQSRSGIDATHTLSLKTEFMTRWDGLLTDRESAVIVLGTTNRPGSIDPAILRRLPRQFEIRLPETVQARLEILELKARHFVLDDDVDLEEVAEMTRGYSGSDLDALCQAAQSIPAREFARVIRQQVRDENKARRRESMRPSGGLLDRLSEAIGNHVRPQEVQTQGAALGEDYAPQMRPISRGDFAFALGHVRPTGEQAAAFEERRSSGAAYGGYDGQRRQENAGTEAFVQAFEALRVLGGALDAGNDASGHRRRTPPFRTRGNSEEES